jgi:hypothetical protein
LSVKHNADAENTVALKHIKSNQNHKKSQFAKSEGCYHTNSFSLYNKIQQEFIYVGDPDNNAMKYTDLHKLLISLNLKFRESNEFQEIMKKIFLKGNINLEDFFDNEADSYGLPSKEKLSRIADNINDYPTILENICSYLEQSGNGLNYLTQTLPQVYEIIESYDISNLYLKKPKVTHKRETSETFKELLTQFNIGSVSTGSSSTNNPHHTHHTQHTHHTHHTNKGIYAGGKKSMKKKHNRKHKTKKHNKH